MKTIAKSYIEAKNMTRGRFGVIPRPLPVEWNPELNQYVEANVNVEEAIVHPEKYTWAAWDPDWGWIGPWPADDVMIDNEAGG